MRLWPRRTRIIKTLGVTPPAPLPGRSGLAIMAMVAGEQSYVAEWARTHLDLGADHLLIYDNAPGDGTVEALRDAVPDERLTVIPWRLEIRDLRYDMRIQTQVIAIAHAIANFGPRFARMTHIDVDEFLIPARDASIPAALERIGEHPNVSLPWLHYTSGGHLTRPPGGVLDAFTRRVADPRIGLNFKTVFDPCAVTRISVHHMETAEHGDRTANDRGEVRALRDRDQPEALSTDVLRLHHYFGRSAEETEAKIARGVASRPNAEYAATVRARVARFEAAAQVEDNAAPDALRRARSAP